MPLCGEISPKKPCRHANIECHVTKNYCLSNTRHELNLFPLGVVYIISELIKQRYVGTNQLNKY